jgi:long-subunit acyl-CoA synthetase (AMP-forming)
MESKKMIKSPLFHQATGQNGISWILVFYKPARKTYPTITEDDYEYILNHSGAIYCFVSDAEYFKSKFNKDKVPYLKEYFLLILLKVVKLEELLLLGKTNNQTMKLAKEQKLKAKRFSYNNLRDNRSTKRLCSLTIISFQTY